jgi:hypothetical protein
LEEWQQHEGDILKVVNTKFYGCGLRCKEPPYPPVFWEKITFASIMPLKRIGTVFASVEIN